MKEKLKSRKLIVFAALFVASTTFMALGMATFSEWSNFNMYSFGIYAGGNIGEHYTNRNEEN